MTSLQNRTMAEGSTDGVSARSRDSAMIVYVPAAKAFVSAAGMITEYCPGLTKIPLYVFSSPEDPGAPGRVRVSLTCAVASVGVAALSGYSTVETLTATASGLPRSAMGGGVTESILVVAIRKYRFQ